MNLHLYQGIFSSRVSSLNIRSSLLLTRETTVLFQSRLKLLLKKLLFCFIIIIYFSDVFDQHNPRIFNDETLNVSWYSCKIICQNTSDRVCVLWKNLSRLHRIIINRNSIACWRNYMQIVSRTRYVTNTGRATCIGCSLHNEIINEILRWWK